MPRLCRSKRWIVAVAAVVLAPVTGCGASEADSDRATVIGSWQKEFCPTVQPDLVAERLGYREYEMGPAYQPMGSATSPNTFDCTAMIAIDAPKVDDTVRAYLTVSIYNGKQPTRSGVEAYYKETLDDWYKFNTEHERAAPSTRTARRKEP